MKKESEIRSKTERVGARPPWSHRGILQTLLTNSNLDVSAKFSSDLAATAKAAANLPVERAVAPRASTNASVALRDSEGFAEREREREREKERYKKKERKKKRKTQGHASSC
jgi:hypothetical protein